MVTYVKLGQLIPSSDFGTGSERQKAKCHWYLESEQVIPSSNHMDHRATEQRELVREKESKQKRN